MAIVMPHFLIHNQLISTSRGHTHFGCVYIYESLLLCSLLTIRIIIQAGDNVWVRTVGGNWHSGKVTGQTTRKGQTREVATFSCVMLRFLICYLQKEGLFYPVMFNDKIRKYFAPLNGEIKPDTVHVRHLLKDAGWI